MPDAGPMPLLHQVKLNQPSLKFKTKSFHREFSQIKGGSSRIIIKCKILEAGDIAVIDGEEQAGALNLGK